MVYAVSAIFQPCYGGIPKKYIYMSMYICCSIKNRYREALISSAWNRFYIVFKIMLIIIHYGKYQEYNSAFNVTFEKLFQTKKSNCEK